MKSVYHLGLDEEVIKGARAAFLPGDPDRVPAIAETIAKTFDKEAVKLAHKREFRTYLGEIKVY